MPDVNRGFRKPVRPFLQRGKPLSRRLLFAIAPGWQKGFINSGQFSEKEDVLNHRGSFQGSTGDIYGRSDMGTFISSGLSNEEIVWNDPNNLYDHDHGISIAWLGSLNTFPSGADRVLFAKRNGLGAGGNAGWNLRISSAPRFRMTWSDGSTEQELLDTTFLSANETHLVVWTHPGGTSGTTRLWRNGVVQDSAGVAQDVATNNVDIALFGSSDLGSLRRSDANCGMAAVWNRELTRSEIMQLWADPYKMWKRSIRKRGPAGSFAFQDYFLAF